MELTDKRVLSLPKAQCRRLSPISVLALSCMAHSAQSVLSFLKSYLRATDNSALRDPNAEEEDGGMRRGGGTGSAAPQPQLAKQDS